MLSIISNHLAYFKYVLYYVIYYILNPVYYKYSLQYAASLLVMSESNKARKSLGVNRYKYVTDLTLGHDCFRFTDQKTLILFMKKDLHRKHH